MSISPEDMLGALDDELINRFKTALELGKWPDGQALTQEQKDICMQAVIVYEHKNVPEEERTGYVPPKETPCAPKDETNPIKWQ